MERKDFEKSRDQILEELQQSKEKFAHFIEGIALMIAEIVYQHQEKIDGSGYPRGLKDPEILIEAKILAVANAVEAMTSNKSYRPALTIAEALTEIEKEKNILFDPKVVDRCVKLFREKEFLFP